MKSDPKVIDKLCDEFTEKETDSTNIWLAIGWGYTNGRREMQEKLDKVQNDKNSNDADYLKCSSERNTLQHDLDSLRYFSFAQCLYEFEQQTEAKRDDIIEIFADGGHGYVHCVVKYKDTAKDKFRDFFVSDEILAGFLIDWAKATNKLSQWRRRVIGEYKK